MFVKTHASLPPSTQKTNTASQEKFFVEIQNKF